MASTQALLTRVRGCTRCDLPHAPRPVVQLTSSARILVASQAPGRRVHASGVPFDDPSGERLRTWMGVSADEFYDARRIAIVPMGLCFPGTGAHGDFPPRPECAPTWRALLLGRLPKLELTLAIGRYAQAYHLAGTRGSVAAAVADWRDHWPQIVPLPHPSGRNNIWLAKNPWFERELVPRLRKKIKAILARGMG